MSRLIYPEPSDYDDDLLLDEWDEEMERDDD